MLQNVTLPKVKGKVHFLHTNFPGFRIDKINFSPRRKVRKGMGWDQTLLARPDACPIFMFPVRRGRVQAGAPVLPGEISPAVLFMSLLQLEQNINSWDQGKFKGSLAAGQVTSRRRLRPAWLQFKHCAVKI